jgi:hypothetical protein
LHRSLLLAAGACAMGVALADAAAPTGARNDVVFSEYSPLSRSMEIVRRSFSPLTFVELSRAAAASGKQLRDQPLDLSRESFAIYTPDHMPPDGYSLLVFVSPLESGLIPSSWHSVLDRHGTIVVSASKSGNDQPIWDRRVPLALIGAFNIMQRYTVNPKRVYVGGFSGGSRVAMRLALDYPDLFHGALLNAGSDPIAAPNAILPSAQLFEQFQRESQILYYTGDSDSNNVGADMSSRQSMNEWCVFGTAAETMFRMGHEPPSRAYLDQALTKLQATREPNADRLASCRKKIAAQLAAKLQHVRLQLDLGKPQDALKELREIDLRYGGLAAPESLELFQRINPTS